MHARLLAGESVAVNGIAPQAARVVDHWRRTNKPVVKHNQFFQVGPAAGVGMRTANARVVKLPKTYVGQRGQLGRQQTAQFRVPMQMHGLERGQPRDFRRHGAVHCDQSAIEVELRQAAHIGPLWPARTVVFGPCLVARRERRQARQPANFAAQRARYIAVGVFEDECNHAVVAAAQHAAAHAIRIVGRRGQAHACCNVNLGLLRIDHCVAEQQQQRQQNNHRSCACVSCHVASNSGDSIDNYNTVRTANKKKKQF